MKNILTQLIIVNIIILFLDITLLVLEVINLSSKLTGLQGVSNLV